MARESKYPFPRFYIKNVGGQLSIEHRLTHSFIRSVETEKEAVAVLKEMQKMDSEEFWRMLMKRGVRIPTQKQTFQQKLKEKDEAEEWFYNAWSIYTDQFYDKYPKLLVVEEQFPFDLINKIRKDDYAKMKEEMQKQDAERRAAEEAYKEQEKAEREKRKESEKPKEVIEGKLGNGVALEKLKRKARKGVKKLKIKTKKVAVTIEDSIDPFA